MIRVSLALLATACLAVRTQQLGAQTHPASQPTQPPPNVSTGPVTPVMLSSRAAYDEAMRPLEMTRRELGNWSDVEVAALNLAIQQAGSACSLRDPLHVPVDELVDLARLCGVGQRWEITMLAAHQYINAPQPGKPQLAQAYADAIEAELRLKMGTAALQTAQEMLAKVPYDNVVSGAYNMALDYLQFADTKGALTLGQAAQPLLLAHLNAPATATTATLTAPPVPAAPADTSSLILTQAYRDALRLPALEIYVGQLQEASTLAASVEAALPTNLAGDDTLLIAAERRRFALLGQPLPPVDVAISLDPQHAPARELPLPGLTTALLLFPDWCAQCVRMGSQFPEGKFTVSGRPAAFYALIAQTRPLAPATPLHGTDAAPRPSPLDQLRGTPTLLVPATTLLQLEATDYPLLLLVDEKGIVRVHQQVGDDALQSGSTLDTAIAGLGATGTAKPLRPQVAPITQPLPAPALRP